MPAQAAHEYCEDCIRKDRCEYRPTAGTLLRCLDKQTASGAHSAEPYRETASGA
ncbi:MAG: hypothetical protein WCP22_07485 [Chlamydiota bacterium]